MSKHSDIEFANCTINGNASCYNGGAIYALNSSVYLSSCSVVANKSGTNAHNDTDSSGNGGALYVDSTVVHIENSTLVENACAGDSIPGYKSEGAAIYLNRSCSLTITNSILTYNHGAEVIVSNDSTNNVTNFSCTDIYGNEFGDWIGSYADQLADSGNFSANPYFCDPDSSDYHLYDTSPCAPANNSCNELIGALDVNCKAYSGPEWWVSTTGSDDTGDGSEANPYLTIRRAVDASADGDTVLITPGTYTGDGNWDIAVNAKKISIVGDGPSDSVIVDCHDSTGATHFGLFMYGTQDSTCRLNAFTILSATKGITIVGQKDSTRPVLDSLNLSRCAEALELDGSSPYCRNLLFDSNNVAVYAEQGTLELEFSRFFGNGQGLHTSLENVTIMKCSFDSNQSGIHRETDCSYSIDSCDFSNNIFAIDGYQSLNFGPLTVTNSSFVDNTNGVGGDFSLYDCEIRGGTNAFTITFAHRGRVERCSISQVAGFVLDVDFHKSRTEAPEHRPPNASDSDFAIIGFYNCSIFDNPGEIVNISSGTDGDIASLALENCSLVNNGGGIFVDGYMFMDSCVYAGNVGGVRIMVDPYVYGTHFLSNNSFIGNKDTALIIYEFPYITGSYPRQAVTKCLFTENEGAGLSYHLPFSDTAFTISCNNSYNNAGGNYAGVPDQTGLNGNISEPPYFCNADSGDYHLYDISACAPANNACSTLIGALGVACIDTPPSITSGDSVVVLQDSLLVYHISFTEPDGPDTLVTVTAPSWLTLDADSLYGTPIASSADTSILIIVSDGFKADTSSVSVDVKHLYAEVTSFEIDGNADLSHILTQAPLFSWSYGESYETKSQLQFEIAIGTDTDWTYAEMWNPAPFTSTDTSVTYNGSPLVDGSTYYGRLRAKNDFGWSAWYNFYFRLNSVPTVPQPLGIDNGIVSGANPILWLLNSTDAEGDGVDL